MTRAFDILPDGKFIGLVSGPENDAPSPPVVGSEIRIVLNWFEELKQRVPTK
jgi:hypothetical protein